MPRFYYSHTHKAFVKQCSCCKELFIGSDDMNESLEILGKTFTGAGPSSGMADGLQSRCCACNASKRRSLGISQAILEEMWQVQDGKCAICQGNISIARGSSLQANVDHDEATGTVRELLCGGCNRGIGMLKHEPRLLRAAAAYCEKHMVVVPLKRRA